MHLWSVFEVWNTLTETKSSFPPENGKTWKPGKGDSELGNLHFLGATPPKTNVEPENEALEEEISIKNHHFQVPC